MPPSRGWRSDQPDHHHDGGSSALPLRSGRDQSGDCATGRLPPRNAARCPNAGQKLSERVRPQLLACSSRPAPATQTTHWSDSDPDPADGSPISSLCHPAGRPCQPRRADEQLRWKDDGNRFRPGSPDPALGVDRALLYGSTWLRLVGLAVFCGIVIGWVSGSVPRQQTVGSGLSPVGKTASWFRWGPSARLPARQGFGSSSAGRRVYLKPAGCRLPERGVTSSTSCVKEVEGVAEAVEKLPVCTALPAVGAKPVARRCVWRFDQRKLSPFTVTAAARAIVSHAASAAEHPPATSRSRPRLWPLT